MVALRCRLNGRDGTGPLSDKAICPLTALHVWGRISPHVSPALYSIAVADAILGNRSLRCSTPCIPAVVPPTSMWSCGRVATRVSGMALRKMGQRTIKSLLRFTIPVSLEGGVRPPWRTRSPGQRSTGPLSFSVSPCAHFPRAPCIHPHLRPLGYDSRRDMEAMQPHRPPILRFPPTGG